MKLTEFENISRRTVEAYLSMVENLVNTGGIISKLKNPVGSYPQTMIITTMPDHFAFELIGGRRRNKKLKLARRNLNRSDVYFGQFDGLPEVPGMINFADAVENSGMDGLQIVTATASGELDRRFPGVADRFKSALLWAGEEDTPPITISSGVRAIHLNDMLLVAGHESMVRIRHIRLSIVISKNLEPEYYRTYLEQLLAIEEGGHPLGFTMLDGESAEITHRAAQFANVFLMDKLRETSIGSFLAENDDILLSAFGAKRILSEPSIDWQVSSPDPDEKAINPDLFIQRPDEYWDVYDLKLPLLEKKRTTTGPRKRRLFLHTIEDGIAQLAHYKDFLEIPEHKAELERKYGVKLNKPIFGLIVGNYENMDPVKTAEAKLRLESFEIIDYDSILQLYLASKDTLRPSIPEPNSDSS